jgi:HK97 gp10 family phage protein
MRGAADQLRHPRTANAAAAEQIARQAAANAPRRTGALAGSVHTDADDEAGRIVFTVDYALPVNAGTRRMRARPFLTDALDQARNQVAETYTAAVVDAMATVRA